MRRSHRRRLMRLYIIYKKVNKLQSTSTRSTEQTFFVNFLFTGTAETALRLEIENDKKCQSLVSIRVDRFLHIDSYNNSNILSHGGLKWSVQLDWPRGNPDVSITCLNARCYFSENFRSPRSKCWTHRDKLSIQRTNCRAHLSSVYKIH